MPSSKKYTLFSKSSEGAGKPVCAFFASPDGCRNGRNCPFLHDSKPENRSSAEMMENTSVISSEGSEQGYAASSAATGKISTADPASPSINKRTKLKRKNVSKGDDLFASPKTDFSVQKKKKTKRNASVERSSERGNSPVVDFRGLMSTLPVAAFSVQCDESRIATEKSRSDNYNCPQRSDLSSSSAVKYTLPKSTEGGSKWIKAVQKSQSHEKFSSSFNFDKCKESNKSAGIPSEWVKAKAFGTWASKHPQAIAIDCEMCETQDPLSGAKNSKALCRFSVVNAEKPEEVLVDTLVKPAWPVSDYRTRINGITKEDLDNVEFTLRHAQAFMMALCSEETVIIGHAVQNDLMALNMEHYCIADSSFLYQAKDSTATVSLKDLVSSVLHKDMPDTHDSVNDSRKALECVVHWMEKDGMVQLIERTPKNKGHQLFVHRIPKRCKTQNITSMFLKHTSVEPLSVSDIEFSGETGKTYVSFRSARHANLAFETLEGKPDQDKSGRLQKKVYLRTSDYVRVCKMSNSTRGSPRKPGMTES